MVSRRKPGLRMRLIVRVALAAKGANAARLVTGSIALTVRNAGAYGILAACLTAAAHDAEAVFSARHHVQLVIVQLAGRSKIRRDRSMPRAFAAVRISSLGMLVSLLFSASSAESSSSSFFMFSVMRILLDSHSSRSCDQVS